MKNITGFFLVMIALLTVWPASVGRSGDTRPLSPIELKTIAIVDAAYEFVVEHSDDMDYVQHELESNPDFKDPDNDLYIFMHCYEVGKMEAVCCGQGARPELVGKNMWHLRTPNGRLLFHEIREIIEKDGKGWIEYDWLNPFTKTIQTKCSYARSIHLKDGREAWIGSGYWKE